MPINTFEVFRLMVLTLTVLPSDVMVENDFTFEPPDVFTDDWLVELVVFAATDALFAKLKLVLVLDGSVPLVSVCMPLS